MRLSIRRGNNRTRKKVRKIVVVFNGQIVNNRVFELDTKQGWIRGFKKDPEGRFIIKNGEIVREERHGKVEVHAEIV